MTLEDYPKIAVIGATGFIGRNFLQFYKKKYPDCIGTSRKELNLTAPNIAPLRLAQTGHKAAIILAAITDIKKCETQKEATRSINIKGTIEVIRQLVSEGIKPIFASSDYVFEGSTGNYSEDAIPKPMTEYGKQKYEVEAAIADIAVNNFLVIRYGKIFSLNQSEGTLFHQLASALVSGATLKAAYDQIFNPTLVSDLTSAATMILAKNLAGFIHVCSPESWSRYDLALSLAKAMKVSSRNISKISLDELNLIPLRPKNTSLRCDRLRREIGFQFTPISQCVETVAKQFL